MKLKELEEIKTRYDKLTPDDFENIFKLKKQGYSYQRICLAYNRERNTLDKLIKKYKEGTFKEDDTAKDFDTKKMIALLKANWSISKIANEFCTSTNDILKRIQQIHIEICLKERSE